MTKPNDLQQTLEMIEPTHVAVAYLGIMWKEYLKNIDILEEVIVSPTIGSNPAALSQLLDNSIKYGFNVYFCTTLHAKLFIGKDSCLIGSSNLSQNGFGGGLYEAAVCLTDAESLDQAHRVFETLKQDTVTDPDQQREMVEELRKKWNKAYRNGVLPNEGGQQTSRNILEWNVSEENVWLSWYQNDVEGPKLNNEKILETLPEIGNQTPEQYFDYYFDLHKDDDAIREGDWWIIWQATQYGRPHLGSNPSWMRVDKLIPGGCKIDGEHHQLAVMLPSDTEVPPPFELDKETKKLIKELLKRGNYPNLLMPTNDEFWYFKNARKDNRQFLVDLQRAYSEIKNS